MASRDGDTNDPAEEVHCPLRAFGCVHSFPRNEFLEHYTSQLHYKSVIGSICANRLTHEEALRNLEPNLPLIGETPSAAQQIVSHHQQFMKKLTTTIAEIYGSSSSASARFRDQINSNRTSADHILRSLIQRTDEDSRHELTLPSLQTQGQLNDTKINELHSLMTAVDNPTNISQSIESPGQNQNPPVANEPSNTEQPYMVLNRMLQTQLHETPVSTDGLLIWKVDDISEEINKAVSKKGYYIDSPSFQTCMNGHRFWARFYPNGKVDPRFLSFEVHLNFPVKSPFRGRIIFTLVDRSARPELEHIIQSCQATGSDVGDVFDLDNFADKNLLHGYLSNYIRDDSIYLLVRIVQTEEEKFANLDPDIKDALLLSN